MPAIMLCMLGLARVLPWLSPKQLKLDGFRDTYEFIMLLVLVFLGYVHAVILWAGLDGSFNTSRTMLAGIFLFFALLGNDTHRFAPRLSFVVGIAGFVAALTGLPFSPAFVLLVLTAVVPVGYSLLKYKQFKKQGKI
jgi:low temperature requirement protein LtrA